MPAGSPHDQAKSRRISAAGAGCGRDFARLTSSMSSAGRRHAEALNPNLFRAREIGRWYCPDGLDFISGSCVGYDIQMALHIVRADGGAGHQATGETLMKLHHAFAAAAVAIGLAPAVSHAGGWQVIGTRDVTDRVDHDEVIVEGHQLFDSLKICVRRHPVQIYDVDVYFHNGGHQDVEVRSVIGAGNCTRVIDLEGGQRDIQSIKLVYEETSRLARHATVVVWAQ
jgi:hypothetical protein